MIINDSNISLTGTRKYKQVQTMEVMTSAKVVTGGLDMEDNSSGDTFQDKLNNYTDAIRANKLEAPHDLSKDQTPAKLKFQVLSYLFKLLFAKRNAGDYKSTLSSIMSEMMYSQMGIKTGDIVVSQECKYSYFESETTSFHSQGTVITKEGLEIPFNIELNMERSFYEEYVEKNEYVQSGAYIDPLVINLDCSYADVSDQKFYFDLDADGEEEYISKLSKGSGYLALDNNDDGIINDGSELFGTSSGDGFLDLSAYDLDKNGWIDEADEVFSKLKIWSFDNEGNPKLYTLKESGVGALYLSSAGTGFAVTDSDNSKQMLIRKTGLFLFENGKVGTMQHVDMAI